jgi:hypothetical protein
MRHVCDFYNRVCVCESPKIRAAGEENQKVVVVTMFFRLQINSLDWNHAADSRDRERKSEGIKKIQNWTRHVLLFSVYIK